MIANKKSPKMRPKSIIILPKYKLCYVDSPKNGCSSIKCILASIAGFNLSNYQSINHLHHVHKKFDTCPIEEVPDDYFKFTCIRNPFDRVVSYFSQKIKGKVFKNTSFYGITQDNIGEYINDFNNFVRLLREVDTLEAHLAIQKESFYTDKMDYLIRLENFNEGIKWLLDKYNITHKIPHKNKSKRGNYRDYYNKESRNIIQQIYKVDLEAFGYEY